MTTPLLVPGLVTGIGSLPHVDPDEAAAFALVTTPALPAMPSGADMIEEAMAGVGAVSPRALLAARPTGPVKVQLAGPVTLAVASGDASAARAVVHRNITALGRQLDGRPALCFLDEPSLGLLSPAAVAELLPDAVAAVAAFATPGVHCCASVDWSLAVDAGARVLSLPVELAAGLDRPTILRHLDGGGWVAWGAVPTDRPVASEDVHALWRALDAQLGRDPRLPTRSIVTPACGLALHTVESAETVFALARELGQRITVTAGR